MTLSDLERRDARNTIFRPITRTLAPFDQRRPYSTRQSMMGGGRGRASLESSTPHPKGTGLQQSQVFGTHAYAHTVCHKAAKFCIVVKLDKMKVLQSLPRPGPTAKFFVRQMLTRDMLAVANILVENYSLMGRRHFLDDGKFVTICKYVVAVSTHVRMRRREKIDCCRADTARCVIASDDNKGWSLICLTSPWALLSSQHDVSVSAISVVIVLVIDQRLRETAASNRQVVPLIYLCQSIEDTDSQPDINARCKSKKKSAVFFSIISTTVDRLIKFVLFAVTACERLSNSVQSWQFHHPCMNVLWTLATNSEFTVNEVQ